MNDCQIEFQRREKIDPYAELLLKKYWSPNDVAFFTSFKKSTIYNKVHKDDIPYRKRGGKLYFIPREIQNWMMEGD